LAFVPHLRAEDDAQPRPFVAASTNGYCYFKLVPEGDLYAPGKGAMYLVEKTTDTLIYTTEGWFASQVIVATPRYMARVIEIGRGNGKSGEPETAANTPPDKQVALAFYDRGKLLKQYTVAELLADPSKISALPRNYLYFKDAPRFYTRRLTREEQIARNRKGEHGYWVIAEMRDGQRLFFDMSTGERCKDPT